MDSKEDTTKGDAKGTPEVNQDDHVTEPDFENTQTPQLQTSHLDDDDDSDEYSSSVFSYDDEDYEFFENSERLGDLVFMVDDEDVNMEEEEDDIDPDDMSYEELLALGEIVGEANRGLTNEQISSCLMETCEWHSSDSKTTMERCVVCQMEYEEGEKLVVLSACSHTYHGDCISQWLQVKKTCPVCNAEVVPSLSSVGTSTL